MSLASDGSKNDIAIASDPIDETVHESVEAQTTPEPLHLDLAVEIHKVTITKETHTQQDETHKDTSVEQPAEPVEPSDATPAETPADTPSQGRSRRARRSEPVYNIAQLSGTAIHGKRRSKGDIINDRKRRTTIGTLPTGDLDGADTNSDGAAQNAGEMIQDGINALNMQWSMKGLDTPKIENPKKRARSPELVSRRISTRSAGPIADNLMQKVSAIGKKGKKVVQRSFSNIPRELRKLQDTNEYAKIDTKPVLYSTWAKGKLVGPDDPEPPRKKAKTEESKPAPQQEAESTPEAVSIFKRKQNKKWLDRGLYSGQEAPLDIFKSLTPAERKSIMDFPELIPKVGEKPNSTLPAPMFNGLRLLIKGRDFKLPYDICNPLPPGQPKPEGWRTMTKNRFVGGAGAYWKKTPHFKDYQSKCVCTPEDGCTESCQNRIMLYECDDTNCNSGSKYCQNRAFARLTERTKQGGKYRVGVEVVKTNDRGYGIRANRCFEPGQIIMEYTGEIITEEECDRRMNEKYKDNQCYYLMSFDQNMIIDATTGSIARFVNHSCSPNCHMIKWIVSGQPRMALFAGDRPIMTGEELTYDYNFDPFSAKNVQKCLCGSPNCRGVLGPRPKEVKEVKPAKHDLKKTVKDGVKAGKRKIQELIGDKEDGNAAKKRKIKTPTAPSAKPVKRSVSGASLKAAKDVAAKVVRKTVSTISVNTKGGAKGAASPTSSKKVTTVKRKATVVRTYSKGKATTTARPSTSPKKSSSRKSSLTIVAAAGEENQDPQEGVSGAKQLVLAAAQEKSTPTRNSPRKSAAAVTSPTTRKGLDLARVSPKIRLVQSPSKTAA
ncbi:histone-lysine N-methyltransferase ASH1L [Apiospora phragmitis]|uniref:Histone-lysine N-methyltransferase ASH1L n=1 Tax=Apiospora phragmitis TaxID=2905665 RepID=A0ABR1VUA5_9PEZI